MRVGCSDLGNDGGVAQLTGKLPQPKRLGFDVKSEGQPSVAVAPLLFRNRTIAGEILKKQNGVLEEFVHERILRQLPECISPPNYIFQALLGPRTKCKTSEINATTSKMCIMPLATWKTVQPMIHAINRITNKIVKILIAPPGSSKYSQNAV